MAEKKKIQTEETDYEEVVKKKLDKIIEQTSNENSALKKILESLNDLNEQDNKVSDHKKKRKSKK
jgi:mRNA-degrading endonuclease YafQ of YafQ-DinJ toxin-antitoxin module